MAPPPSPCLTRPPLRRVQGVWKPAKIPNPKFYNDTEPLKNIGRINAAAIEIWTMDSAYYFDDIVVANDPRVAEAFLDKTWGPKHAAEVRRRAPTAARAMQGNAGERCCAALRSVYPPVYW